MNEKLKKNLSSIGILGLRGRRLVGPACRPARRRSQRRRGRRPPAATQQGEADETEQKVTGPEADRAGRAALQAVGDGKVLSVEKETPEQGPQTPEPGEKPDSAEEQTIDRQTAYDVEVQRSDGTTVEVALDGAFNVLDSEQESTESPSEQAAEAPAQR
jgi:hypothetical protein